MSVLDTAKSSASQQAPESMRWSVEEFFVLAAQGHFQGRRVLLFEGEIIQMPPMGHEHKKSLVRVMQWLTQTFEKTSFTVQIQMPLIVGGNNELEPDGAIIAGSIDEQKANAETALFVIEVSDTSLGLDRKKASKYAAVGVSEYWIINIPDRQVEIYRLNVAFRQYSAPIVVDEAGVVAPIAKPDAQIRVSKLLP